MLTYSDACCMLSYAAFVSCKILLSAIIFSGTHKGVQNFETKDVYIYIRIDYYFL